MSSISGLLKRVQSVDMDKVIEVAFVKNEGAIADENRKQLFEGFDKKGKRLKPYKNKKYAAKKHARNPIPGLNNPDFFDKGDFQKGIEFRIDGNVIRGVLNDPKSDALLKRDPDIIGLGGTYKKDFIDTKLRPSFLSEVHKELKI